MTVLEELDGFTNKLKLPPETDASKVANDVLVYISPYCVRYAVVPFCIARISNT